MKVLVALHTNNILHGDPRIDNILLVENKFRWIDFRKSRHGAATTTSAKSTDLKICITSLFHSGLSDQILSWYQGKFRLKLLAYGEECPSEEKALSLLKQVTARVQTLKCCDN